MKIAYNPLGGSPLAGPPDDDDITFDLIGHKIYVRGETFDGTEQKVFKKHTSDNTNDGYNGLVPVPSYTATNNRFLREDGTWVIPTDTKVTQSKATSNIYRPLLVGYNGSLDVTQIYGTTAQLVYFANGLYANPATSTLYSNNEEIPNIVYRNGYIMKLYVIDATKVGDTKLDENTWYPVTMILASGVYHRIEVRHAFYYNNTATWSTHESKRFGVLAIWETNGSIWGLFHVQRRILAYDERYSNSIRGIGQLTNSSTEYIFVRGGAKYYFYTSHGLMPTLQTSAYVVHSQTVEPTTTEPPEITTTYYTKELSDENFAQKERTVYFVQGTQTGTTGSWTGSLVGITPYDGLCIKYYLPYSGSGSASLSLNGGPARPIYRYGRSTPITTHFPAGSIIPMTYRTSYKVGNETYANAWIVDAFYDANDNYTHLLYNLFPVGGVGVFKKSLCAINTDLQLESFTTTFGNENSKLANTKAEFPIGTSILYTSNEDNIASGGRTSINVYDAHYYINITYTGNGTLKAYLHVYLAVTINLANNTWSPAKSEIVEGTLNQYTSLIVTGDELVSGNYYIYIGHTYSSSASYIGLNINNPLYYYNGTNLIPYEMHTSTLLYLHKSGDTIDAGKQLSREGSSASWIRGRDYAMIRQTTRPGYSPIISAKSDNGSWEFGPYTSDIMYLVYAPDDNYKEDVNSGYTLFKFSKEGTFTANTFVKSGGSSSLFLKADGSVDSNVVTLSTNLTITGTKTFSSPFAITSSKLITNLNADLFDGHLLSELRPYITNRDFKNGTLITTNILYNVKDGAPFYLEIKGNSYDDNNSVFTLVLGYIYDNTISRYGVTHLGYHPITGIVAKLVGNYLCFWFPRLNYWHGYFIFCSNVASSSDGYTGNRVTNVEDKAEPEGTKKVELHQQTKLSAFTDTASLDNYYTKTDSNTRYITLLGADGDYLTLTQNGTTTKLTAPYSIKTTRVISSGFATNTGLTFYLTINDFNGGGFKTWASYLIANHGKGETYYSLIIRLPFDIDERVAIGGVHNGTKRPWKSLAWTTDNFPTSQINELKDYSKPNSTSALASTDTLNQALGKLEYKADAAYNFLTAANDEDDTIENLKEILDILSGIKDTDTIQALLGKYLPLTGGTITSASLGPLTIKRSNGYAAAIKFENSNGVLGYVGMNGSPSSVLKRWDADSGGNYVIWDSGNHGKNSGLNADMLDDLHAKDFIGGRNLILKSHSWNNFTINSAPDGVTHQIESGVLKVVSNKPSNGWMKLLSDYVIEDELQDGDPFTFSIEIKSENSTDLPNVYFKEEMGYYSLTGTLSSKYSIAYYTGTWKKDNDINLHLGWSSCAGTYYIKRIKFERGYIATAWSPAYEDYVNLSDLTTTTIGIASKLGTSDIGSATKGIYLDDGTPKAMTYSLSATVNAGVTSKLAYYSGANVIDDYTSTVGGTAKPIYLNAGVPTALSGTVGGASTPVYLNKGTITACTISDGSSNSDKKILVTNGANDIYSVAKATLNYSTGLFKTTSILTTSTINAGGLISTDNTIRSKRFFLSCVTADYFGNAYEFVIKTPIVFQNGIMMPEVHIHGYAYDERMPIDIRLVWYIYNNIFDMCGYTSSGWTPAYIYLSTYEYTKSDGSTENRVAISIKHTTKMYYHRWTVDMLDKWSGNLRDLSLEWTVEINDTSAPTIIPEGNIITVPLKPLQTSITGAAEKLTTVSKTIWGLTYWTANGIPTDISGNMTGVGSISANGNNTITKSDGSETKFTATNSNGSVALITSIIRGVYDITKGSWLIGTNGTNTWLSSGNVGIGTTSPGYKLQVQGSIGAYGGITSIKEIKDENNNVKNIWGQFGPDNESWCHFHTNAPNGFWFLTDVVVNGHCRPYNDNNAQSGTVDRRWSCVYSYSGDFTDAIKCSTYKTKGNVTILRNNSEDTVLSSTGGDVYIRPNGDADTTNQVYVNSSGVIYANGFYKQGSSKEKVLLGNGGDKNISDFMLKTDELTNNVTTINKTLTVTDDWMDTGIDSSMESPLSDGTYIILVYVNNPTDNMYNIYSSGIMSWYAYANVTEEASDEIVLHRAGLALSNRGIYLRTVSRKNVPYIKLQIAASDKLNSCTYTFKFKRVI